MLIDTLHETVHAQLCGVCNKPNESLKIYFIDYTYTHLKMFQIGEFLEDLG